MNRNVANIVQFYSTFHNFRYSGKYTDIIFKCENTLFQCHQVVLAAACSYFHSLFNHEMYKYGLIRPVIELNVPMKAVTFQAVLQFIYTGDTAINTDNIYSLIVASDFLDVKCLEEQCIQYLKKTSSFKDYVEIINYFAHRQEHRVFTIIRDLVINHLKFFLGSGAFPEFPFWFLHQVFLDSRGAFKMRQLSPEAVNMIITRWINHSFQERQQYSNILFGLTKFKDPPLMQLELLSLEHQSDRTSKNVIAQYHQERQQHTNTFPGLTKLKDRPPLMQLEPLSLNAYTCIGSTNTGNRISSESLISENRRALKVFIDHRNRNVRPISTDNYVQVFEVDENTNCFPACKSSQKLNIDHEMKCVAIDNTRLFCLNYYHEDNTPTHKFQFSVCASIDKPLEKKLKLPAIGSMYTSHFYELCEMKKSVLFHDQLMKQEYPICLYNEELDTWSKLPKMIEEKIGACVVYSNDTQLLYAIGGQTFNRSNNFLPTNTVQAYDYRMNRWQQLPGTILAKLWAACCLHKGKIFVSGGVYGRNQFCEVYDPVAGKWQEFQSMMRGLDHHRMMEHANALWVVGGQENYTNNLSIDKYDPLSNTWCTSPSLEFYCRNKYFNKVLDAVVFEPHS